MKMIVFIVLIFQTKLFAERSQPVLMQRSFTYLNYSEVIEVSINEGIYGVSITIVAHPITEKKVTNDKKWVIKLPDVQLRGLEEIDLNSLVLKVHDGGIYEFSFFEQSEVPRPRRTFLIKDKKLITKIPSL